MIKIWLDDIRSAPDNSWIVVRNAEDAWEIISKCDVEQISLDHDLGENKPTGYDLCNKIEAAVYIGTMKSVPEMTVHSANPVGRANMERAIVAIKRRVEK